MAILWNGRTPELQFVLLLLVDTADKRSSHDPQVRTWYPFPDGMRAESHSKPQQAVVALQWYQSPVRPALRLQQEKHCFAGPSDQRRCPVPRKRVARRLKELMPPRLQHGGVELHPACHLRLQCPCFQPPNRGEPELLGELPG